VLEGSVRKSGDTLRITAQLVRASDSSHLWSQSYDRQMTDVFKVQDEICAAVVDELKIKLLGAAPKLRTTDPRAYALFLKAREATSPYTPAALQEGIALYQQALDIDSNYAPAWDGLADAYLGEMYLASASAHERLPLARMATEWALTNDATYAPAYARLAMIEGYIGTNLAASARHLEQGLALDPANLDLIATAALIARQLGRLNDAIDLAEYVVTRDPFNVLAHDRLGILYFYAGRPDDALEACQTVLNLSPAYASEYHMIGQVMLQNGDPEAALAAIVREPAENWRLVGLSMAYHALGRRADSDAALSELIRKHGRPMSSDIAYVYAFRGDSDRAFEWLGKFAGYQEAGLAQVAHYPMFENLHDDTRWLPFLRKHGIAPEQLASIKLDVTVPE
jgi:tetratricopeptide (TPR) repeat protein